MENSNIRNNRRKFFIAKLFFLSLSIFMLLTGIVLLSLLIRNDYREWVRSRIDQENAIYLTDGEEKEINSSLDQKIQIFGESAQEDEVIELSADEFVLLTTESIESSLPQYFTLEDYRVVLESGYYRYYLKLSLGFLNFPWVEFDIKKDSVETAEFYISDVYIAEYSFREVGFNGFINRLNNGIDSALASINDGNFAGWRFENIELNSNGVIIRAKKNLYID